MATYAVASYQRYDTGGAQTTPNKNVSTVTEGVDDNTFVSGESVTYTGGSGLSLSYYGSYNDGSNNWLVFENSDGDFFLLSGQTLTPPVSIIVANISTGSSALCFLTGTTIDTPEGAQAVETISIGDLVKTNDGTAVPVKWIGRQTVSTLFGPAERLMPVRFKAGSLGKGVPHTDLTVTADHGMLVDGVVCHAGALENGTTITRVPLSEMGEAYTVYHIETEAHEIIFANGAPAETFIDNVSRRTFDNFAEFDALYGDVPEMEELDYPRAMSARQVPASIRTKLSGDLVA